MSGDESSKRQKLGKNKSVANLTLPDFLKAPVSISEKFSAGTRKLKFIKHLNSEFHSSRDPNISLPLPEEIE